MSIKAVSLAAVLSVAGLTSAVASTVTLNYVDSGSPFGSPNWSQSVNISNVAPSESYTGLRAGPYRMNDGTQDFLAWCIDIFQYVGNGVAYTVNPNALSQERTSLLSRLFTSFIGEVDDAESGAAMQLAIWEIVNETDSMLTLGSGNFSASNNTDAIELANFWLGNMGNDEGYSLTYYTSASKQDLMTGTPSPVPVPAALLMLVTGLGALGAMRRRNRAV